jgi:SP family general alpha glucoside:H+ symporter-like MFS transporter
MQQQYGYRRTMQLNLILITGFIFIVFFANSIQVLFVGELLCGLPWGAFSSSAVSYASAPPRVSHDVSDPHPA